jgi:hypothetical protein
VKLVSNICERCGAKILDDTTRGLCPACLLESGLGLLDDESVAGVGSSAVASANADDADRNEGLSVLDGKRAARSSEDSQ